VTCQHADPLSLEHVPNVAVVVVVTGEKQTARDGECDGGDAAENVVVDVRVEFAVRSEVEETAGGVVGTGGESLAVWEESECAMNGFSNWRSGGQKKGWLDNTHWTALMSLS
jgi:hypothetical protein